MSFQLSAALSFVQATAPVAAVFIILAAIMKRDRLMAAFQGARREIGTNIWLILVNYMLLAPLFAFAAGAVQVAIGTHPVLENFWSNIWAPVIVILAIVIIDFAAYWRHRLEHDRALWQIHATHHSDEAMNWLSVTRKHPIGRLLSIILDNAIVMALGFPVWAIVAANLFRTWWGYFTHADVPWTLGPVGRLMISPAAHRLHHIRDEALMGTNYANTITLWDRLFGTYCDPTPYINCQTGIAGGSRNAMGELARPFEAVARRFRPAKPVPEQAAEGR